MERLYLSYNHKIGNAMNATGEGVKGEYEGAWNAAGELEGWGVFRYADGDVYEWEWVAGEREGRGMYRSADGLALVTRWKAGADVGEGAAWSADRATAWRLQDDEVVAKISLEEAARIAQALGLAVPPRADAVQAV